jgi:hypothetical protein
MDNLNDLKTVWLTAKTDSLPAPTEVINMAKKYRNSGLRKKIVLIVCAVISTGLMVGVIFIYHSTMLTTRLGECCIIISALMQLSTNVRSIGRFYRFTDYNNKDFIQFLEQTRLNQIRYYKKTQAVGLILSSVGLALYLFETIHINFLAGLVLYVVCGGFLLLNWFYIRPRIYRKHKTKVEEAIKRLEKIADQL